MEEESDSFVVVVGIGLAILIVAGLVLLFVA